MLINGRRHVPTATTGSVDLKVVPTLLVGRVEVVTGGASAAYGSDAVAGVVNIVLRDDLTGIAGTAQGGIRNMATARSGGCRSQAGPASPAAAETSWPGSIM